MVIVDIKEELPIIVYDNQCYLCVKFAKAVEFLTRGNLTMIGHYSDIGTELKKSILGESALEMFWFIDNNTAYGGRAALIPLIKVIFSAKKKKMNTCFTIFELKQLKYIFRLEQVISCRF